MLEILGWPWQIWLFTGYTYDLCHHSLHWLKLFTRALFIGPCQCLAFRIHVTGDLNQKLSFVASVLSSSFARNSLGLIRWQVHNLFWSWHSFYKNKVTFAPPRFKKSTVITETVQFWNISLLKLRFVVHSDNRKHSVVLLNFHTLLLIRNKSSDFFVATSLKLSAHSLAHNYSEAEPRAIEEFKLFRYLFFRWSKQENPDQHKYVVAKDTRIDEAFVLNFL